MSTENSITMRIKESVDKIDVSNLNKVEEAELAQKCLGKIEQYMILFRKLDVGVELSANSIKEMQRLRRYMRHRLDTVKEAA